MSWQRAIFSAEELKSILLAPHATSAQGIGAFLKRYNKLAEVNPLATPWAKKLNSFVKKLLYWWHKKNASWRNLTPDRALAHKVSDLNCGLFGSFGSEQPISRNELRIDRLRSRAEELMEVSGIDDADQGRILARIDDALLMSDSNSEKVTLLLSVITAVQGSKKRGLTPTILASELTRVVSPRTGDGREFRRLRKVHF